MSEILKQNEYFVFNNVKSRLVTAVSIEERVHKSNTEPRLSSRIILCSRVPVYDCMKQCECAVCNMWIRLGGVLIRAGARGNAISTNKPRYYVTTEYIT